MFSIFYRRPINYAGPISPNAYNTDNDIVSHTTTNRIMQRFLFFSLSVTLVNRRSQLQLANERPYRLNDGR